ncbi:MAG: lysophospholipid acyltransferase family protein [Acetobacterium sp.]|uniref:lysophospholipid acyltransferase family protein n=1 Tax=Acetobacterium sp. TaxID=1872094 RepID=UPI0032423D60
MIYKIGRFLTYLLSLLLFRITITGKENIPECGGALICPNHISNIDPVVISFTTPREIHYMAKAELFKNPLLNWFFKKVNAFPVNREKVGVETIKTSLKILKEEKILGIFPEGHRVNPEDRIQPASGFVVFAIKTKSPIIPVRIRGKYRFRSKIEIIIGEPVYLEEYYGKKLSDEETRQLSEKIMDTVYGLELT